MSRTNSSPVFIIGAGLSGLACALHLKTQGIAFQVLEAGEEVGGRVRTDLFDGFRLDRGFQVLQTAYPEAQRLLRYPALKLHPFEPGALIRTGGRFVRMSDPWRRPRRALASTWNGIGTLADRWRLARLRHQVLHRAEQEIWAGADSSTADYLHNEVHLSEDMIRRFIQPWFSGVFFEDDLATSSRFFQFVFRMFALGDASLPEEGMGAIPRQLAEPLPEGSIRFSSRVDSIEGREVVLSSGERLESGGIVLAVEGPEAVRLAGGRLPEVPSRSTTCLYFAAPEPPLREPILVLNGDGAGPINNLCVPSNVSRTYAPEGRSLVSVSLSVKRTMGMQDVEAEVRRQLTDWFGAQVDLWSHLHTYEIPHALPDQGASHWSPGAWGPRVAHGLYCCGDYCETASIQGALVSGRRAAEAVARDLVGSV